MDLLELWKKDKTERFGRDKAAYVENRDQLLNVDPSKTDYLLGKLIRIIFWLSYLLSLCSITVYNRYHGYINKTTSTIFFIKIIFLWLYIS